MSPAVTLPVFGSASNQAAAGQSGNSGEWDSGNADPMDFDLRFLLISSEYYLTVDQLTI
jgi:hypothetical protein